MRRSRLFEGGNTVGVLTSRLTRERQVNLSSFFAKITYHVMIEGGNIMKSYTKTVLIGAALGFISGYCMETVRQWGFNEGVNEGKIEYEAETLNELNEYFKRETDK